MHVQCTICRDSLLLRVGHERAEAAVVRASAVSIDDPLGRVAWHFQMASCHIRCADADGAVHTSRKGLRSSSCDGTCETSRGEMYVAAQVLWSYHNKSEAARLDVDFTSTPLHLPEVTGPPLAGDRVD